LSSPLFIELLQEKKPELDSTYSGSHTSFGKISKKPSEHFVFEDVDEIPAEGIPF